MLHQQASGGLFVGGEPNPGGKLFGPLEIFLQSLGQGVAMQTDHALIRNPARSEIEGQDQGAIAAESAQRSRGWLAVPAGQRAQGVIRGHLRHQQPQWPARLDLQGQQAVELDGGRQQGRGGHDLAQHLAHRRRVDAAFQHRPPGSVEMDDLAAGGQSLEQETV